MRKAKKLSLTLMASVMALGVIAFTAQPANASYGYKYTDSIRPPVLTPTPSTGRAPVEPVATTVTPAPAAKTITTVEPTKTAGSVTYTKALRLRPKGFTICSIILCFCQLFVYV